MVLLKLQFWSK